MGPAGKARRAGGVAFSGVATKTEWSLRECVQASIGRLSLPPSPPAGLRGKLLVYVQVTTEFSRWPQLACAYLSSQRRPNCNMPYGLNTQRLTRQTPNSRTAAARLHLKERAREKQLVKEGGGDVIQGRSGLAPFRQRVWQKQRTVLRRQEERSKPAVCPQQARKKPKPLIKPLIKTRCVCLEH